MMNFVLVEAPTLTGLVDRLNTTCTALPRLRPHGQAFYDAGRWRQIMVEDIEVGVPADNPYVSAYSSGMPDDEPLSTKVARLLSQGYVLWGPQQGDEYSTWQVMVARSAIGGGV